MSEFDDQSARRISKTVRDHERRVRNRAQKRARWHGKGGSSGAIVPASLTGDLNSGSSANATLLTGSSRTTSGATVVVHDIPTMITAAYKIASGTIIRVYKDPIVGQYVLATIAGCQVAQ